MEKNWYANGLEAHEGQSYGWTQTPLEVNITLKLPSGVKARDLDVKLGTEECKVRLKAGAANEFLMEGKFVKPHRMDESNWWVDDGVLNVQLTKLKRSEWWMSVFEGHKEITWDQLQPEHPTYVEDLDGDTQAMVKKMMFDNQQRQRGLPTSEDMEKMKFMEQFQQNNPNLDFSEMIAKASQGLPTSSEGQAVPQEEGEIKEKEV